MIDVKTADRELQTYLRPQTFPVDFLDLEIQSL